MKTRNEIISMYRYYKKLQEGRDVLLTKQQADIYQARQDGIIEALYWVLNYLSTPNNSARPGQEGSGKEGEDED